MESVAAVNVQSEVGHVSGADMASTAAVHVAATPVATVHIAAVSLSSAALNWQFEPKLLTDSH